MMKRKLAKHNGGLSLVTEDIMSEIFLWLPIQSLIRFKSLSKRWYFLITHKDSYFRRNYLSTLSSSRRRRNRIVGSYDLLPIMAGFFYQSADYMPTYDRIQFLPSTTCSSQLKKYNIQEGEGEGEGEGTTTATTTDIVYDNINPFSSLDESLDKFISCCLRQDPAHQKIFIVASSNGFILCSLEREYPESYYLVNPVTMEWAALPELDTPERFIAVGFVCKGDYPSLDLVEYTIVRSTWLEEGVDLLFEFFSSGDNEWREYTSSCESFVRFSLSRQNPLIVMNATTTNSDDQRGAAGIVVYLLVMIHSTKATGIVVFDLSKGEDSLQMIETPGPLRGLSVLGCDDYIREFDGVIHYVRFCLTDFEFWVLNIESREWCLKHRVSVKTMMAMKGYPWTDIGQWNVSSERYHIHAFHPMNPNLIFLTLYSRMVCYNIETGRLEVVRDFLAQNMLDDYNHHVYQWPCWPPLL